MKTYVQRNPFAPKAVWWKRFNSSADIGQIIVYTVSNDLGFIIDEISHTFKPVQLINGVYNTSYTVKYISITNKAVRYIKKLYMFNSETQTMEEEDVVDEDTEIVQSETNTILMFERNVYVRQRPFDCQKESDQENSTYQPISGLITSSSYLTIKTHNFTRSKDEPKSGDLIYLHNQFWNIEDTSKTYVYLPKENSVLHISLKAINK